MNKLIKKIISMLSITTVYISSIMAQEVSAGDSSLLIALNQQIDNYVVERDTTALDKLYASDFVFSHGSGKVEGKKGWFTSVTKGGFLLRQHDSVKVELHPAIGIVKGKLSVQKKGKEKTDSYYLYYIRVYAFREKQWLMISHNTTAEYHLPSINN